MAVSTSTTTLNCGTPQVETASVVGTITLSGNATFTVTGVGITGSPLAVTVAVLLGDTAVVVTSKAAAAINLIAAINTLYTAYAIGSTVVLIKNTASANDSTLNLASANGTCTGLTAQATSANTTAGAVSAKLIDILDYPDTGSAPSKLDTSTLSTVKYKTNILGLQDAPDFTFNALYSKADYIAIVALGGVLRQFTLVMGSADGTFIWNGYIDVFATGAGVDEVRKLTLTISATSEVVML